MVPPKRQRYQEVNLDKIVEHPDNKRQGDVGELVELIRVNGFVGACTVQTSSSRIVAGNHRHRAMVLAHREILRARSGTWQPVDNDDQARMDSWLAWEDTYGRSDRVPVIFREMTDAEARRHLIADNVASDKAMWDRMGLVEELQTIFTDTGSLEGTGFDGDDLDALMADLERADEESPKSDGSMLYRSDVSIADPINTAERGAVYQLGAHYLVCADVMVDWSRWVPLLVGDAMFVPYPGPYLPLAERATRHALVMVQPDVFIAGHLLDKWVAVHGEGSYERINLDAAT